MITGVDVEEHGAVCLAVLPLLLLVGGVVPHLLRVAGGVEQLRRNCVSDWHSNMKYLVRVSWPDF